MHVRKALAVCAVLGAVAGSAAAASPAEIDVTLRPLEQQGAITRVEVIQTITGVTADAGGEVFSVPARVTTIAGQVYGAGDVAASDQAGPLSLRMSVVKGPTGSPLDMRIFSAQRATVGTITLGYTAQVTPAMTQRQPGPSYDLRSAAGGFGGAFFSFLLLPVRTEGDPEFHLSWDLGRLPAGARGVSTLGEGDVRARLPLEAVNTVFFLGGEVRGRADPGAGFRAYWIGDPPFDADAAAAWSARSYAALQTFFRDQSAAPYVLLMRPYSRPRDGGAATRGGFMLEYGLGRLSDTARRIMFTHEMVHNFVGSLDGDTGANAWFGEGLAEFYKIRVPLRAGLITLDDAVAEISVMTEAYYNSAAVRVPYALVGARRWADPAAQATPYNRGFVYFAKLDAAVRAKSSGRRSLDDLVLAMLQARRAGQAYDEAAWRTLLRRELGSAGVADFDHMLAGELIVPPVNAFGPCLTRTQITHPRPVLGMSEDTFLMQPTRVRGLQPGSEAEKAGLREGDEVISFQGVSPRIAHSASNVRLAPRVEMILRRDGQERTVSFSTAGPLVSEYRWSRAGQRASGCVL